MRLLKHFETNNNPEYITRAFTKWTPNITDLFENLPRRQSASKFLRIIEHIQTPKYSDDTLSTEMVILDNFDLGVVKYVAGFTLSKTSKSNNKKEWGAALSYLVTERSSTSNNEYFNFMQQRWTFKSISLQFHS